MIMHVITNLEANAGAETMLARLIREPSQSLVVSLIEVADRHRQAAGRSVRFAPMKAKSAPGLVSVIPRLAGIIRRERPDVILCWMYHAMLVGALAHRIAGRNARLFWNVRQSLDNPEALSQSVRGTLRLCRTMSEYPDGIVFNSARARTLHRGFGFRNANVHVIPNGFDLRGPVPPQARPPRIFGIAARLHPQKDHRTFFGAAGRLWRRRPDVRFVAAGAGLHDDAEPVRSLLAQSGLPPAAIRLCGEIADMGAFYEGIDVLVLSSLTEGFPNVIAEAMSYGRPVVTTDVGDAAAIVGDTGLVVPAGDERALATAMEAMLQLSPEDYRQRSLAARQRIADLYALPRIVDQYRAICGEI